MRVPLIYRDRVLHAGLVRLPGVLATQRITLLQQVLERYGDQLNAAAVVTVRGSRIRVSSSG